MKIKKRKLPTLDDLFECYDHYLVPPNDNTWQPALVQARRRDDSEFVLVKSWRKTGAAIDTDLRDLWRREALQADRLKSRPGAEELLVPIIETSETQDSFYAVMPGEWTPLSVKLRNCTQQHWLRNLNTFSNRQYLWRNVRRLFDGLKLIHDQRVVYGGLNEHSIYTASDHEIDFRIGGFEWCANMNESSVGPKSNIAFSPTDDFASIGSIVTSLLRGVNHDDEVDSILPPDFSLSERALLRALTNPIEPGHLDRRRIEELLVDVEKDFIVSGWGENGRYLLGIQLNGNSLSEVIRKASDGQINLRDRQEQLSFIKADIEAGSEIIVYSENDAWLLGQSLAYKLIPDGTDDKKWKAAKINKAQPRDKLPFRNIEPRSFPSGAIEIDLLANISFRMRNLGSRVNDWTSLIKNGDENDEPETYVRLGMLLTDVVLTVSSAVSAIPVKIVERKVGKILLCAADVDEFKGLRSTLRLKEPARNLQCIFELEEDEYDCTWTLRSSATIGTRNTEIVSVTFDKAITKSGQRYYQFLINGKLPDDDNLFLSKSLDSNPYSVVKRRTKLLANLKTHKELLNTLDDPESTLSETARQPLAEDQEYKEMDPSKQLALQTIWRKTPMQAIVGPPGVGKTHLLSDYTRRILEENPGSRILVTAQGHQALDNAGQKLSHMTSNLANNNELMVVRSQSDRSQANKELFASTHARNLLECVEKSTLFQQAPSEQQKALKELLELSQSTDENTNSDRATELRSFETTVMHSAAVLLSTTNSSELARLIEDGALFDEVIIEEAAKATGPELLAPLLLSMQRLLIGDHRQLPAFDSERLLDLLEDPDTVAKILKDSEKIAGSLFRDHGLEKLLEVSSDDDQLALICDQAKSLVLLFARFIEKDEKRSILYPKAARLSVELTEQRRMHPVICDLVSSVFYDNKLVTSISAKEKFKKTDFPINHLSRQIPNTPIVWVDLPYIQKEGGCEEFTPRYHNPAEQDVVLSIIKQMQPAKQNTQTSMAILSPYRQQVDRLNRKIRDKANSLEYLDHFQSAASSGAWAGTVDAFQGSEADVVIVSLVRNNDNFGRSALGFVSDPRRMGVLLSRAKHQLILVGSYDFFQAQARRFSQTQNDKTGAGCIPDLMDKLKSLRKGSDSSTPPKFVIVPSSSFTGEQL
ncbi:MAG: hypothetical protein DHS20C07_05290 [Methyloligella sp.]|nr:MAG: hypothetical protein DHS20C07_05290 [Methyloligella sp.]